MGVSAKAVLRFPNTSRSREGAHPEVMPEAAGANVEESVKELVWNEELISDFVRRLGFLDADEKVKGQFDRFLYLNQVSLIGVVLALIVVLCRSQQNSWMCISNCESLDIQSTACGKKLGRFCPVVFLQSQQTRGYVIIARSCVLVTRGSCVLYSSGARSKQDTVQMGTGGGTASQ